ncbi:hypothetical protein P7K49_027596 [Saguinus oedipus]|uniref:Uncharacterized protein n=1 Tax=Saguinus oedipus TaxID=9490 RepID=A0ABQ9U9Y3_SAGOE|nr:hypothetical protein P7K49_027596 [Saguinus oedipus]
MGGSGIGWKETDKDISVKRREKLTAQKQQTQSSSHYFKPNKKEECPTLKETPAIERKMKEVHFRGNVSICHWAPQFGLLNYKAMQERHHHHQYRQVAFMRLKHIVGPVVNLGQDGEDMVPAVSALTAWKPPAAAIITSTEAIPHEKK